MAPMENLLTAIHLEGAYQRVFFLGYRESRIDFMDQAARINWRQSTERRGSGPVVWSKVLARHLRSSSRYGGARS
jgi:hypothetical protein